MMPRTRRRSSRRSGTSSRRPERFNPELAGRPTLIKGDSQLLFGGMGRLTENCVVVMKNKSFSITAEVDVPAAGAEGVLIAQGGAFGGLTFMPKEGKRSSLMTEAAWARTITTT